MTGWVDLGIENMSECKEIGSGGFATVYSATENLFGRTVAIKVLYHLDDAGRRRFDRERMTMGLMDGHPNVITPHTAGYTSQGFPYLVMEYAPGGSLADLLADEGPIGWDDAARYLLPVADALGHGHSQGVLHRDVKPENILLGTNGIMKLADFGIASIREATATQAAAFTLAHSPPETFAGGADQRDERSDLYSLASSLYMLVAGQAPYAVDSTTDAFGAYLYRIENHPVPMFGQSPKHHAFLKRALAKDPNERPRNAAQFSRELRSSMGPPDNPTVPAPVDPPPPRNRPGPTASPLPRPPPASPSLDLPNEFKGKDWWEQ